MRISKRTKVFTVVVLSFILLLIGIFYSWPYLFEKHYPPPDTPEWKALQKSINVKGYITEEEMEKLDRLGDEEIQKLREQEEKNRKK